MQKFTQQLERIIPTAMTGTVVGTEGTTVAIADFPVPVGAVVQLETHSGCTIPGEVIGFQDHLTLVYPFQTVSGIRRGAEARLSSTSSVLRVGPALLGRVVNSCGACIDGLPTPSLPDRVPREQKAPPALERPLIRKPLGTGIRAIDGLLTCGRGQRLGIFSGAGVGKSVLLGTMAQQTTADINVIALIGERGREVSEFIQQDLGPTGMKKSVLVVATSDEPAILRIHAAHTATAIAEYFRGHGKNVLLLMDSLSRYALAQREIGLAAGEPPTTKGFPPSVFSSLPRLVERAGTNDRGSITAFYTVLVEGDDLEEPISDTTRGILDGHIVLSRSLAARGHYPSIDVLQSLSRLMDQIVPQTQLVAAQSIRALLAAYQDHEDMISIGAYRSGSNRQVDMAIILRDEINRYLRQDATDACTMTDAREALIRLAEKCAATSVTAVANSDASTAKIS